MGNKQNCRIGRGYLVCLSCWDKVYVLPQVEKRPFDCSACFIAMRNWMKVHINFDPRKISMA